MTIENKPQDAPDVDTDGTEDTDTPDTDDDGTGEGDGSKTGDGPVDEDGTEDTAPGQEGDSGADDVSSLPPWAQKMIKGLRREAAKTRTKAKQEAAEEARKLAEEQSAKAVEKARADAMDAVAKAFGLKEEEKELTPEEVVEKITTERDTERQAREERDQKYRELLVEVAVQDAAAMHDADPGRLLDSRSFMREIAELDVDDPAYRVAVAEAVKKAADGNTSYRVKKVTPPTVSGGTASTGARVKPVEDMTIEELRKAKLHRRS